MGLQNTCLKFYPPWWTRNSKDVVRDQDLARWRAEALWHVSLVHQCTSGQGTWGDQREAGERPDPERQDTSCSRYHHPAVVLSLCLKCTYFLFKGEYYLQIHGVPVSLIVCNLYMEYFQQWALAMARHLPRLWKCYMDDTKGRLGRASFSLPFIL